MAVKTSKMIFREYFLTLTDNKLIFASFKSASAMTGPPSFLLQPKLFWLKVLSSKYLLYDFNATNFKKIKKKLDIFLLLVPLEILSLYHDIDISIGLEEILSGSWIKFPRKSFQGKGFDTLFRTFLPNS